MLAWAIKHWDKGLYIETVRRTRAEAIDAFLTQFDANSEGWREISRYGVHRAVRVTVDIWVGH